MSFRALFDFARLRQRPRWIVPLTIAAVLSGAMPAIHQAVFGPDLIAHAVVTQLEADVLHKAINPAAQDLISARIAARPLLAPGLTLAVLSALLILASAVVLNVATLVVGAEVTPGQVLCVASVAACAETVLRILMFAGVVMFVAPERVVTFDWTRVGRSNFAFLEGLGGTARWTTFVSSVDVITIVSVAVGAIGLMAMDRKLGAVRAAIAASVWPAIGITLRVLLAGLLGIPLR